MVWSSVKSTWMARDQPSTMMKAESGRSARPTEILPKCPPVDLGLLPGQRTQAKVGRGPGSQATYEPARLSHGSRVAAGDDHLVDACGAELGILRERGADEVGVGVECAGPNDGTSVEARRLEGGLHGIAVKRELARNGADAPVLGVEEAPDLGALGFGNHETCPLPRTRACPSFDARAGEQESRGMAARTAEPGGLADGQ